MSASQVARVTGVKHRQPTPSEILIFFKDFLLKIESKLSSIMKPNYILPMIYLMTYRTTRQIWLSNIGTEIKLWPEESTSSILKSMTASFLG
jgi:hypothetical protein